jgi:hypothetical protein
MIREAHIEGENRFWLLRDWSHGDRCARTLTYVMLNPSKADGKQDDHTIRKCVGFSTKLGSDPVELRFGVGRWMTNLVTQRTHLATSDGVVFAWGSSIRHAHPDARARALRGLADVASELGVDPLCFGTSRDGHPLHPLMLPYTTQLESWKGYDAPEWGFLKVA